MLLSPPSPPSAHRFPPHPPEHKVSQSSRSPLGAISVPSNSYPSIENYSYSPTSASSDLSPKTSAFFGSPFVSPSQSSSSSQSASYLSKTAAFFSSPFSESSSSPPSEERTPRDLTPSRSLTADFFTTAAFSSCPTSPPSLRSSTSNASLRTSASHTSSSYDHHPTLLPEQSSQEAEATPVPKPQVPLFSRLFPSRYSSNLRRTDDNRLPSQRGFVTIEAPDDVLVSSPTTVEDTHIPDVPAAAAEATPTSSVWTTGALVHPENESEPSYELVRRIGHGAFSHVWLARIARSQGLQALTAVKMIARISGHHDPVARRTARGERASFLREVEVLHYLTPAHASLPQLYASFSVRTHHVLVLEYVAGGELLEVVNSDEQHAQLSEKLLQRIWCELVGAVEWIHSRFVVHRDIKLENILLTTNPFKFVPPEDEPLIKLTDFGLARKIDPDEPWLSTRCGSESYAAPELLIAAHTDEQTVPALSRAPSDAHGGSAGSHSKSRTAARTPGTYDGRETDAWALGVVLFALVTRSLPFDSPPPPTDAEVERARRKWVLRVVRGEWSWPTMDGDGAPVVESHGEPELHGAALVRIAAVRNLVARLLVNDPSRRARVSALWDEPWMQRPMLTP
ncbi:kinase-like domain-containing protein [Russula emetica]|nr:kinase-like domain-containing protein [Russula emetica]